MDSYTDVRGQSCGCRGSQRPVPANTCRSNPWDASVNMDCPDMTTFPWTSWGYDTRTPYDSFPQTSFTQPGGMRCTSTAPGCLEQQFPVAMAYVPWQQWQTTYAPERGLLQGTIFPDLDLEFNYGRCGR